MSLMEIAKKGIGIPKPTVFTFIDTDSQSQSIILDCTISINTSASTKVTQHPVESGFDISDHIIRTPLQLKISGVISESPPAPLFNIVKALSGRAVLSKIPETTGLSIPFVTTALSSGVSLGVGESLDQGLKSEDNSGTILGILGERKHFDFDYPKKMMRAMIEMCNLGIVISVETNFNSKNYTSMVIRNASFSQTSRFSDSLKFDLDCTEIRIVSTKTTNTDVNTKTEGNVSDPAGSSAAEEAINGTKPKQKASTGWLKRIFNYTVDGV